MLADPATFAAARDTGEVVLYAGFGEGEEIGEETDLDLPAKEPLGEVGHVALELRHRDPFVHVQALALVEGEGVGGVGVLVAVGASRHDHPHRGLLLFHDPDLHRRGMGPQHDVAAEVEGVLGIPGRVVARDVQRFEVVVVPLHLGTVHHRETHVPEDLGDFLADQGQGMLASHWRGASRQRDVQGAGRGFPTRFARRPARFQGFADGLLGLVDPLADAGAVPGFRLAHGPQDAGQVAVLPHVPDADIFQVRRVGGAGDFLQRPGFNRFCFLYHGWSGPGPSAVYGGLASGDLRFGCVCHHGEGGRIVDGEFGKEFPVDFDPGQLHAVYELTVRQAVEPCRRVDPGDPQTAEIATAPAAVAVRVGPAPIDGFAGCPVKPVAAAPVSPGQLDGFLAPPVRGGGVRGTWHVCCSLN